MKDLRARRRDLRCEGLPVVDISRLVVPKRNVVTVIGRLGDAGHDLVATGGLHLDGLADTADALGAGRDRNRALEILRDGRVGTFGAGAIFFDLTLKILALSTLAGSRRFAGLILAPTLARFAMVMVGLGLPYLRESGAGAALLGDGSLGLRRRIAVILLIIICAILLSPFRTVGVLALSLALLTAFLMHLFYRRWLGGVTGDLIGACGEVIEIVVLLVMSA